MSQAAIAQIARAHFVQDHGQVALPGCATCIALARPCIILPKSHERSKKLTKCFHCTLSKQACSIDSQKQKETFDIQRLGEVINVEDRDDPSELGSEMSEERVLEASDDEKSENGEDESMSIEASETSSMSFD
ncbi:hypothetical protein M231_07190 [Tremella mesenterica]|uniref:Uncharacterized protein n=1 Tax=Tremella mesenterica TaxID=5217 RepID=A0A4Q1B9U4_TREME|nr:hypothetical protein M231_07190 [Tremella mesenterica]